MTMRDEPEVGQSYVDSDGDSWTRMPDCPVTGESIWHLDGTDITGQWSWAFVQEGEEIPTAAQLAMRDELVARLARGLDIPPELLR